MMPSRPIRGRAGAASPVACATRRLSAGRRRSGSGRRARRRPPASSGSTGPSARARCTVRAASSHITAALTASRGPSPSAKTPWLRMSTAGERWPASVSTTPRPISSSPISANGADRDLAAELVGHRGHARTGSARRGSAHAVAYGLCVCATPPTSGMCAVDVAVRRGVAGRRERPVDELAVEVADDDRLGREVVVGDAAGLDRPSAPRRARARRGCRSSTRRARCAAARRAASQTSRRMRGERQPRAASRGRSSRSACMTSSPPRPKWSCSRT